MSTQQTGRPTSRSGNPVSDGTEQSPLRAPIRAWRPGDGWGWVWGEEDELGALNAMTPQSILEALGRLQTGRIFDLGVELERKSFVAPTHPNIEVVSYRTPEGLKRQAEVPGFDDPDGVSFRTNVVIISDHAGTQIDGLCHATFGADNHWYNGYTDARDAGDFGADRASAVSIPPIVLGAVLADVAGQIGVDALDAGFAIDSSLLEATLAAQGTEVAPGEAVFVRTGSLRNWGRSGRDHQALSGSDTAGITLEAARWLVEEKGAILIGSDTSTLEVLPPVDGDNASPVHKYLLVDQGVHMGELHYLEELASSATYRFCYVALTPKIRGTTGGFALRPIAIV